LLQTVKLRCIKNDNSWGSDEKPLTIVSAVPGDIKVTSNSPVISGGTALLTGTSVKCVSPNSNGTCTYECVDLEADTRLGSELEDMMAYGFVGIMGTVAAAPATVALGVASGRQLWVRLQPGNSSLIIGDNG